MTLVFRIGGTATESDSAPNVSNSGDDHGGIDLDSGEDSVFAERIAPGVMDMQVAQAADAGLTVEADGTPNVSNREGGHMGVDFDSTPAEAYVVATTTKATGPVPTVETYGSSNIIDPEICLEDIGLDFGIDFVAVEVAPAAATSTSAQNAAAATAGRHVETDGDPNVSIPGNTLVFTDLEFDIGSAAAEAAAVVTMTTQTTLDTVPKAVDKGVVSANRSVIGIEGIEKSTVKAKPRRKSTIKKTSSKSSLHTDTIQASSSSDPRYLVGLPFGHAEQATSTLGVSETSASVPPSAEVV